MSPSLRFALVASLIALGRVVSFSAEPSKVGKEVVTFFDVQYVHRWTQSEQHEFTPQGQEDLKSWSDMVTINYYRSVKDGDGLAAVANSVLENYKSHGAKVIRTDSVPRTPTKPAEYLIVVFFGQPEFIEAVFARLKIVDGVGLSVVYSHRKYGKQIGGAMSAWLQKNGPATEKALMGMEKIPLFAESKK
jgi:hypothetical protein